MGMRADIGGRREISLLSLAISPDLHPCGRNNAPETIEMQNQIRSGTDNKTWGITLQTCVCNWFYQEINMRNNLNLSLSLNFYLPVAYLLLTKCMTID